MRPTLNELMNHIGCKAWPERWQNLYDGVMEDFERHGCPSPTRWRRPIAFMHCTLQAKTTNFLTAA